MSRIVLILATVSLLGCGEGLEGQSLNGLVYLPYFERCENELKLFESMMKRRSLDHDITILRPSKYFVPGYKINSLLQVRFENSNAERVERIANRYMGECGPTAVIEISANSVNEDYVRRAISDAPTVSGVYEGEYDLRLEGNTLSIFFTSPR